MGKASRQAYYDLHSKSSLDVGDYKVTKDWMAFQGIPGDPNAYLYYNPANPKENFALKPRENNSLFTQLDDYLSSTSPTKVGTGYNDSRFGVSRSYNTASGFGYGSPTAEQYAQSPMAKMFPTMGQGYATQTLSQIQKQKDLQARSAAMNANRPTTGPTAKPTTAPATQVAMKPQDKMRQMSGSGMTFADRYRMRSGDAGRGLIGLANRIGAGSGGAKSRLSDAARQQLMAASTSLPQLKSRNIKDVASYISELMQSGSLPEELQSAFAEAYELLTKAGYIK